MDCDSCLICRLEDVPPFGLKKKKKNYLTTYFASTENATHVSFGDSGNAEVMLSRRSELVLLDFGLWTSILTERRATKYDCIVAPATRYGRRTAGLPCVGMRIPI